VHKYTKPILTTYRISEFDLAVDDVLHVRLQRQEAVRKTLPVVLSTDIFKPEKPN
jgi:hypothetical protein